ncbi:HYR domain-containing protein, partial [Seonamhaeicola marinus]
MKKLYQITTCSKKHLIKLMLFVFLVISSLNSISAQVRVPFSPRASELTPTVTTYSVKGDFAMMGNTNLTLLNYSDNTPNTNNMIYVDIDGDSNTFNSSSAELNFSTENGAIPSCSNVVFAGIYWFGKADTGADANLDGDNDPNTFNVTKNGVTKSLDKRKILLKGPVNTTYQVVDANTSLTGAELYFPEDIDINLYTAYADVTQFVRTNGVGEYFVADMALTEGSQTPDGLSGGWGMVVVYENPQLDWRDITVFDGHAFVSGNNGTETFSFNASGFTASLNGPVNVKLGVMAGEGEPNFVSDFLEIEIQNTGTYQSLENTINGATNNFFTSSIETGGNSRTPNLVNNTGVDILTIDIPNAGNSIIANGQTSTSFRYGSGSDGFAIFNLVFAVDAFVPDPEIVIANTSINGAPPGPTNNNLEPGENADFEIAIRNTGTEEINNAELTIPLPVSIDPNNVTITSSVNPPLTTTNVPVYDPNEGVNGSIVWDLGTLPIPADPNTVLANLGFKITVTTDCTVLGDTNFQPTVAISGTLKGEGAISGEEFETELIQGYETTGVCTGAPIPAPIIIGIDYVDYVNEAPIITAPTPLELEGCDETSITAINARYPYSASTSSDIKDTYVTTGYTASDNGTIESITYIDVITSNTPTLIEITRTYSATDDCGNTSSVQQIIQIRDTTNPTITCPSNVTAGTSDDGNGNCSTTVNLGSPVTGDNCTVASVIAQVNSNTIDPATFEFGLGNTTVVWIVEDSAGNTASCEQTVTVNDDETPTSPVLPDLTGQCSVTATAPT